MAARSPGEAQWLVLCRTCSEFSLFSWRGIPIMKILSAVSALFLAAWTPVFSASPPAAPATPSFGELVEVNVVNVDVYATDKSGHRITGLGKDDFELLEDGKRVAISNFEVMGSSGSAAPVSAAAAGGSPAAVERAPEDALNLVVYFDDVNIRPSHRARVLKQLGEFLAQLSPGDRVMMVTSDPGLNVRVPFTSDPAALAQGLREIGKLSAHGEENDRDRLQAFKTMMTIHQTSLEDPIDPIPCPQGIVTPAHSYATSRRGDVLRTLSGLTVLVNSLSGVPGRKALLHVSDGLPINPGEELFQFLLELCGGQGTSGFGPARTIDNPNGSKFARKRPGPLPGLRRALHRPQGLSGVFPGHAGRPDLQHRQEPAGAGRSCQRPAGDPLYPAGLRAAGDHRRRRRHRAGGPSVPVPLDRHVPAVEPPGLAADPGGGHRRALDPGRQQRPARPRPHAGGFRELLLARLHPGARQRRPRAPARGARQAAGAPPPLPPELPRQAGDGKGGGPHARGPLLRRRGESAGDRGRDRRHRARRGRPVQPCRSASGSRCSSWPS